MSGGSYDYIFSKIEDICIRYTETNPRREAFQQLLKLVARAMQDIEWVDSCDCSPGDENNAIDKCLSFLKADSSIIYKAAAYDGLKARMMEYFKEEPAQQ